MDGVAKLSESELQRGVMSKRPVSLYAWGSNGSGQLGVGHEEDLAEPQKCLFRDGALGDATEEITGSDSVPNGDTVRKLVAGGNHTLILTHAGRVYASGCDVDGRCGVSLQMEAVNEFTVVTWAENKNITDIAATWEASYFVEDAKVVWACGSGSKGELGLDADVTVSTKPLVAFDTSQIQQKDVTITAISGCMNHVVLLLSNGQAYGWGNSRKGNLGQSLRAKKLVWKPESIELPPSFRSSTVVTGRDFTVLLNSRGEVVVSGDLKLIPGSHELKAGIGEALIFAGWSTVYTLSEGKMSGYGLGRRGQLPPDALPDVIALAAGSEHCVALLDKGQLAAWGWGEHGNCGSPVDDRGCVVKQYNTLSIPAEEIPIGVGAGCASSFVWTVKR